MFGFHVTKCMTVFPFSAFSVQPENISDKRRQKLKSSQTVLKSLLQLLRKYSGCDVEVVFINPPVRIAKRGTHPFGRYPLTDSIQY
jgi:hypothetical protein